MSDTPVNDDDLLQPDPTRRQIESLIRAARWVVQPSEDLRPRTLEAARDYCDDRRAEQRLGGFVLAVLLLLAFTSPAIQYVSVMRVRASVPSTTEIHHRAMDYASQREVGPHWGMAEVYSQMRRVQAGRLGHSYRTLK